MRKLILCAMLMALPSCCGTFSAADPVTPCRVAASPGVVEIPVQSCGEHVCLTVENAVALTRYIAALKTVDRSLEGCHLIAREAP